VLRAYPRVSYGPVGCVRHTSRLLTAELYGLTHHNGRRISRLDGAAYAIETTWTGSLANPTGRTASRGLSLIQGEQCSDDEPECRDDRRCGETTQAIRGDSSKERTNDLSEPEGAGH
jgi:hypothetical protein